MDELQGVAYLKRKLSEKQTRANIRYNYYEMKHSTDLYESTIPARYRSMQSVLGWCGKAVDSLADRLRFREFKDDNFDLNTIYQMNNPDLLFDSAILSALITSCCFIYIYEDKNEGLPRMQVIDGSNATGIMDEVTGLLVEGYAVLARDENKRPTIEAYFTKGKTEYFYKDKKKSVVVTNHAPYPLLVPIIYRPDARRPFGHSRISRACMKIMQGAQRTVNQMTVSAEFYSFPQKYVTGLSEEVEEMDKWKATMSTMLAFYKDSDGDKPTVGQFSQQSMAPYIEELRAYAAMFAGETGLTLDDLGFVTDNPSSAEAIKASHENLRLAASKAQRTFGSGFLNAGYLAACLRDGVLYKREQLYLTKPIFEPVFEPDAAMLSMIGDGAIKLNQAVPEYINRENLRDLTGITGG